MTPELSSLALERSLPGRSRRKLRPPSALYRRCNTLRLALSGGGSAILRRKLQQLQEDFSSAWVVSCLEHRHLRSRKGQGALRYFLPVRGFCMLQLGVDGTV